MPSVRSALIVAIGEYQDPALRRLRSPVHDAEALRDVLGDPAVGEFDVTLVLDESEPQIRRRVSAFFANRHPDDTLLLHVSCHGVKDESGELYFAMHDTELPALDATALPAEFVRRQMNRSRSRRIVLLLDCCYAGAFSRGWEHRGSEALDLQERFHGRGHVVLTASSSMEYAFEGGELTKDQGRPSVFTSALVRGLRTGEADSDGDGSVSVDELYQYLHDQVQSEKPEQTPLMWNLGIEGKFVIAKTPYQPVVELPDEVKAALASPFKSIRMEAVTALTPLVHSQHRGKAGAARQALEKLSAEDDSLDVRKAAAEALGVASAPPRTEPAPWPVPAPRPVLREDADVSTGRGSGVTRRRWLRRLAPIAAVPVVVAIAATAVSRLGSGDDASTDAPTRDAQPTTSTPTSIATPGAWQRVADLGMAMEAPGVAVLGGSLWVVGGMSPAVGRRALDTVRVYDPAKRAWRDGPKLPVPLDHAAVASDGRRIYVVGGQTGLESNKRVSAETYRLDGPTDTTWTPVASARLPQPRAAGALAWDGRRLVFAGGFTRPDQVPHADVWALESGKWRGIGRLGKAREHLAVATNGAGRVWFIGGNDQRKEKDLYGTVDIVEGDSIRAGRSTAPTRASAAVWIEGAGVCRFGGVATPSVPADFVSCTQPDGAMRNWPALPTARAGHGIAILRDMVYVVAGFDGVSQGTSRVDALPFKIG